MDTGPQTPPSTTAVLGERPLAAPSGGTLKSPECIKDRKFRHKNGKEYMVYAEDGCFHGSDGPIFGRFGAVSLRDGRPFGPMRDIKISNVKEWL